MDKGRPFRVSQSRDTRPASRPSRPGSRPEEEPKRVAQPPVTSAGPVEPSVPKNDKNGLLKRVILPTLVAVVGAMAIGWFIWSSQQGSTLAVDTAKYQAVFFSNGNVYFGKLESHGDDYYKLSSVYYPQAQNGMVEESEDDSALSEQGNITLLKLSDAIHGPEDEMIVAKDQVLFYQNLKADSQVSQLIDSQSGD